MLASIALVQLDKVERHAEIRRRHVAIYEEGIADLDGVEAGRPRPARHHANHLFVVRVTFADRDEVQRALAEENIGTSIHFLPVHRLSAYRDRLAPHQPPLPVTERAGDEVLSLPLSPAHSDDDVRDAVAALRRVHARLSRMKRPLKVAATLLVTALAVAYILSKVDLGKTKDILASASVPWCSSPRC